MCDLFWRQFLFFIFFKKKYLYLFVWLCRVLAEAYRIFNCGM